ncbi:MAG: hypothetical protein RI894_2600 [Bacteroidota bacterium]
MCKLIYKPSSIFVATLASLLTMAMTTATLSAQANTIFRVTPAGTVANTGASWASPKDLQSAINAAVGGDEIWVAAGSYKPTQDPFGSTAPADPRNKTFTLKNGVKIYGGFFGNESTVAERYGSASTLSGDIGTAGDATDNAYHVLLSVSDAATTVLDGFTISGGNANGGTPITVETKTISSTSGGGMYNNSSSPTLTNLTFSNNKATFGGGIQNTNASPIISNALFSNNTASYGGVVGIDNASTITITNSTFISNSASTNGGAIYNDAVSLTITNTTFSTNTATSVGGGIYNKASAAPAIKNTILWANTAPSSPNIYNINSTAILTYSIVEGGYAGTGNSSSDPLFLNAALPAGADGVFRTADDGLSLQATSPAINLGTTTGAPTTDLTGYTRTGNPDAGAYEYINRCINPLAVNITPASTTLCQGASVFLSAISTPAASNRGAVLLDGSNDYMTITNPAPIAALTNSDFTIEAWVKTTSAARMAITSFGNVANGQGGLFFIQNGNLHFDVTGAAGPASTATVNNGAWHHVAVARTGTSLSYYIDGTANGTGTIAAMAGGTTYALIGSDTPFYTGSYFNGSIDDVRFWNIARNDISTYKNTVFATHTPTLFYNIILMKIVVQRLFRLLATRIPQVCSMAHHL